MRPGVEACQAPGAWCPEVPWCKAVCRFTSPESDWGRWFWSQVDARGPDECWPGRGNQNGKGYAIVKLWDGHRMSLHVAAYRQTRNLPTGWIVHHTCHNGLCCNPSHLQAMTRSEHGRLHRLEQRPVSDTCPRGHPYRVQGGRRQCQECQNIKRREQKRRSTGE